MKAVDDTAIKYVEVCTKRNSYDGNVTLLQIRSEKS
jgi:hypothetical protein